MTLVGESIFRAIEKQVAGLPARPKVIRNRSWANRLEDLPVVSLFLVGDEVPDDDFSGDAIFHSIYHDLELKMELVAAKVRGEDSSETIYKLADGIARRLQEQLPVLREQAPGLVHVAEGGLAEVEFDTELKTEIIRADKTFIVKYKVRRH